MTKGLTVILGIGLIILWIVGLGDPVAPGWLTWLDGVAGLCAFGIAGAMAPASTRGVRMGGPILLAIGLYALWVIGLATHAVPWLKWWTFAFADAFLLVGIGATGEQRRISPVSEVEQPQRPRKSA